MFAGLKEAGDKEKKKKLMR